MPNKETKTRETKTKEKETRDTKETNPADMLSNVDIDAVVERDDSSEPFDWYDLEGQGWWKITSKTKDAVARAMVMRPFVLYVNANAKDIWTVENLKRGVLQYNKHYFFDLMEVKSYLEKHRKRQKREFLEALRAMTTAAATDGTPADYNADDDDDDDDDDDCVFMGKMV